VGTFDDPRDQRDDHRAEEQEDQRVNELREQFPPGREGRPVIEPVGPPRTSRSAASALVSPVVGSVPRALATAWLSTNQASWIKAGSDVTGMGTRLRRFQRWGRLGP